MLSIPATGTALVTSFVISNSGWATSSENFPLSFAFAYQVSKTDSFLTIATASLRAFVEASLPAGLPVEKNLITVQGQVVDMFLSSSLVISTLKVTASKSTNVTRLLKSNVQSGFSSGNINLVFQTINNVSY